MEEQKVVLYLDQYDLLCLRQTLEEEIDRNGSDYDDVNASCEKILDQLG